MGRRSEGWKLIPPERNGTPFYYVRFRVPVPNQPIGRRVERSTGEKEPKRAAREAARIYADEVHGRSTGNGRVEKNDRDMEADATEWLEYYGRTHAKNPRSVVTARSRIAGFIEYFGGSYSSVDARAIAAWGLERLGQVSRVYHRKERSSACVFLTWASTKGYCAEPPIFPALPTGNAGVRATKQKKEAIVITDEQMDVLLAAMPERSHGGGGNKAIVLRHVGHELPLSQWARVYGVSETTLYYQIVKKRMRLRDAVDGLPIVVEPTELAGRGIWVRPFWEVVWETGLRPVTVMRLEAGRHYKRGGRELLITKDIDKINYERVLPLTERARAALDRAYPAGGEGAIFGVHDYDKQLEIAKRAARTPTRFTKYDVRHSRATDLIARTGDMLGTSYLTGHTQLSTLARYTHARKHDAERVIGALAKVERRTANGKAGGRAPSTRRKRAKARPGGIRGDRGAGEKKERRPILRSDAFSRLFFSRGEWIRTTDPQTPSLMR